MGQDCMKYILCCAYFDQTTLCTFSTWPRSPARVWFWLGVAWVLSSFCACPMLCWHALCLGRLLHWTTLCTKNVKLWCTSAQDQSCRTLRHHTIWKPWFMWVWLEHRSMQRTERGYPLLQNKSLSAGKCFRIIFGAPTGNLVRALGAPR